MLIVANDAEMGAFLADPPDHELAGLVRAHAERLVDFALEDIAIFAVCQPGDTVEQIEQRLERTLLDGESGKLAAVGLPAPAVRCWLWKAQHLVDGLAIDPKIPGGSATAHPVNQHGAADLLIKLHSLHPPPPPKNGGLAGLAPF